MPRILVDREISRIEIGHCKVFQPRQRAAGAAFVPTHSTPYNNISTTDDGIPIPSPLPINNTTKMATHFQDHSSPPQEEHEEYSIPDEDLRLDDSSTVTREESVENANMAEESDWMFQGTEKLKNNSTAEQISTQEVLDYSPWTTASAKS